MKQPSSQRQYGSFSSLAIFFLFSACILFVLLAGAGICRRVSARDQASYRKRTCAQYIATRIRQAESPSSIHVEQIDGRSVLAIHETGDFVTYVYCYDGWLCELYTFCGGEPAFDCGERLIELNDVSFLSENGMLRIALVLPENTEDLYFSLLPAPEADL